MAVVVVGGGAAGQASDLLVIHGLSFYFTGRGAYLPAENSVESLDTLFFYIYIAPNTPGARAHQPTSL